MSTLRTDLGNTRESARRLRFEPVGAIPDTNVQKAIERVGSSPPAVVSTAITSAMSPYTVLSTDSYLYVDSTGGPVQILLEAGATRLTPLVVKDVGGAAFANNITLTPNGAETIDGLTPVVISQPYGGYRLNPRATGYTISP